MSTGTAFAGLRARLRSLHRSLFQRELVDKEMGEEFAHHLAMRTDDLIRQGIAPSEAARRARIEFGHPANHRADAREARGLRPFDRIHFSWLDVKLAVAAMTSAIIRSLPCSVAARSSLAPEPSPDAKRKRVGRASVALRVMTAEDRRAIS